MIHALLVYIGLRTEAPAPLPPARLLQATLTPEEKVQYKWLNGYKPTQH